MQGLNQYFTGVPCRHGHISARYAANHNCVECNRKYRKENKTLIAERTAKYYELHKDKYNTRDYKIIAAEQKEYYQANREKILKYAAEYRKAHKKSASVRKLIIINNI